MSSEVIKREILPTTEDFKRFWKEEGPFRYALTSREFPPVLLEPEEWIFSNGIKSLLKALMQFDKRKMKIVQSPFNAENKTILRPDSLSEWKINNFPEEWNGSVCDIFVPEGHLTTLVMAAAGTETKKIGAAEVEEAFFRCLETRLDQLGYEFFTPRGSSKFAAMNAYLGEWEKDEQDAGQFQALDRSGDNQG